MVKLYGVEGIETGKFVAVSEWMEHGNIVEYIKKYPVNRLDLVSKRHRSSLFHFSLLKYNNSYTTQLRVSSIFMVLVSRMGTSKVSVPFNSQ